MVEQFVFVRDRQSNRKIATPGRRQRLDQIPETPLVRPFVERNISVSPGSLAAGFILGKDLAFAGRAGMGRLLTTI
ncbi:MAG: hypothetical protein ABSD30_11710 [Candidatus Binatus sp.]